MYLKSLKIQNVRGFRTGYAPFSLDFSRPDGTYAGWTVLTGRNGSGKTTFMRAIALALAGPSVARALMPGFGAWVSNGETVAKVQAAFTVGAGDSLSGGGAAPRAQQPWAGLQWKRSKDGPLPQLDVSLPTKAPKLTANRGPWSDNPTGWFLAGYGPFRRLSGAAAEAQRLMQSNTRAASLVTLFDESASLAESTWWLQELYPKQLEGDNKAEQLLADVRALLNDGLLPDGSRATRYNSFGLWIEQNGVELILEEMSDGYRVVAALVIDIVRRLHSSHGSFRLKQGDQGNVYCPQEGVVLIDEVDVHLHVGWQQKIGFWMREHFPNIQFIVSTHSPFICQAASPRGLIRLPGIDEKLRAPSFIEDPAFSQIINGDLDRVAMSAMFGLESTYSQETLERRKRWEELEEKLEPIGDVPSASASPSDSQELSALRAELGINASDEVASALRDLSRAIGETGA